MEDIQILVITFLISIPVSAFGWFVCARSLEIQIKKLKEENKALFYENKSLFNNNKEMIKKCKETQALNETLIETINEEYEKIRTI